MGEVPTQSCFTSKKPKRTLIASSSEDRIYSDESHAPERRHNAFKNESKGFRTFLTNFTCMFFLITRFFTKSEILTFLKKNKGRLK